MTDAVEAAREEFLRRLVDGMGTVGAAAFLDEVIAIVRADERAKVQPLFQVGNFTLHSGEQSTWKVECDSPAVGWHGLAMMARERIAHYSAIYPVPRGGIPFAEALRSVLTEDENAPVLVVDDVLTTGASIIEVMAQHPGSRGLVAFARGPLPPRVDALWIQPELKAVFS